MIKDKNFINTIETYESIKKIIKPGDVINQSNSPEWWQFWLAFTHLAIKWYQRELFGSNSIWKDTHSMLYLDENNTFSVEFPKVVMKPLRDYYLSDFTIYRMDLTNLNEICVEILRDTALQMIGEDYDVGQLLDIGINEILGYHFQRKLSLFDFGRKRKVCSVGVRICFENLGNQVRTPFGKSTKPGKWLFHDLNPSMWTKREIEEYRGTDVEATSPAHFANSNYFCNEFRLIAKFSKGKQIL